MTDPFTTESTYTAVTDWWAAKITESTTILDANNIVSLWWQYQQGGDGIVQDASELNQAVTVILGTAQRSDIHRPEFASNIFNYIDYPLPRATPYVVRESVEALDVWEPRLELTGIDITSEGAIGRLTVEASWQVVDSDVDGATSVELG